MQDVKRTSTRVVLKAAVQVYNASLEDILKDRSLRFLRIRSVIYKTTRAITYDSIAATGRAMGKDHTTVLHWLNKDKDVDMSREVKRLSEASLEIAQRMRDNTLQWSSLTCYNKDDKSTWKLQNG